MIPIVLILFAFFSRCLPAAQLPHRWPELPLGERAVQSPKMLPSAGIVHVKISASHGLQAHPMVSAHRYHITADGDIMASSPVYTNYGFQSSQRTESTRINAPWLPRAHPSSTIAGAAVIRRGEEIRIFYEKIRDDGAGTELASIFFRPDVGWLFDNDFYQLIGRQVPANVTLGSAITFRSQNQDEWRVYFARPLPTNGSRQRTAIHEAILRSSFSGNVVAPWTCTAVPLTEVLTVTGPPTQLKAVAFERDDAKVRISLVLWGFALGVNGTESQNSMLYEHRMIIDTKDRGAAPSVEAFKVPSNDLSGQEEVPSWGTTGGLAVAGWRDLSGGDSGPASERISLMIKYRSDTGFVQVRELLYSGAIGWVRMARMYRTRLVMDAAARWSMDLLVWDRYDSHNETHMVARRLLAFPNCQAGVPCDVEHRTYYSGGSKEGWRDYGGNFVVG